MKKQNLFSRAHTYPLPTRHAFETLTYCSTIQYYWQMQRFMSGFCARYVCTKVRHRPLHLLQPVTDPVFVYGYSDHFRKLLWGNVATLAAHSSQQSHYSPKFLVAIYCKLVIHITRTCLCMQNKLED